MPVHEDTGPNDSHLASLIVLQEIARKHGFTIKGIDWRTMTIDMDGPPENQLVFAQEVDEFLRRCKREEEKRESERYKLEDFMGAIQ